MHTGRTHQRIVIAHHLVLTLYGHWPPNDPRGSGSHEFYDEKFAPLGPIHHGRKPSQLQPSRAELREYHKQIEPLLNFPVIWLDDATRQVVADAISLVVRRERYTCFACAILRNHAHLLIRRHRDSYQTMFHHLAAAIRDGLHAYAPLRLDEDHPVVSQRPYAAYCYMPDDIWRCIEYINANPVKERLPHQVYSFVTPYDNWPQHQSSRTILNSD